MKKKIEGNVCAKCGSTIDTSTSTCSVCGEAVLAQEIAPIVEEKTFGFWSMFFSILFSLLLIASTALLVLLLFVHALNENVRIPAIGPVSSDWLTVFFDSWYSLVLGGALVLIPLLVIVLINTHRMRRIFLSVGMSTIVSALLSIILALIGTQIVKMFSGEWQDALVNSTAVFEDFCFICAIILTILGAACLSIYSCITVIKGVKHEKDT